MVAVDPTIVLTSHQQRRSVEEAEPSLPLGCLLRKTISSSSMTLRVSKQYSEQPKEAEKCFLSYRGYYTQLTVVCFLTMKPDWVNGCSAGKESACNAGDPGLVTGWGRSPGEGIGYPLQYSWASLVVQLVKNLPAVWEPWVQSLGWEDPLEENTATRAFLLGESPRTEKPGGLESTGLQRVRHDWATKRRTGESQDFVCTSRGLGRCQAFIQDTCILILLCKKMLQQNTNNG